jgi:hypothetical protein
MERPMTRAEKPEIASIHDNPLEFYPSVIACLVRFKAVKCVKREIAAAGIKLGDVTNAQIQLLAQAYAEGHRDELIRVACDMVRTGAELQRLAEQEARRRAKAKPKPKDITPAQRQITHWNDIQIDG